MNEERLIELRKETFPTKHDLEDRFLTKGEFLSSIKDVRGDIAALRQSTEESKATSNVVDTILEAHPIERIVRLEKHTSLPKYVHTEQEEE